MTRREDLPREWRYPRRRPTPVTVPPGHRAPLTLEAVAAGFGAHRELHAGDVDVAGCPICRAYLAALRRAR